MDNFLAQTLAGITPETTEGTARGFSWQWIGHGILELTPVAPAEIFAGAVCWDPRQ